MYGFIIRKPAKDETVGQRTSQRRIVLNRFDGFQSLLDLPAIYPFPHQPGNGMSRPENFCSIWIDSIFPGFLAYERQFLFTIQVTCPFNTIS